MNKRKLTKLIVQAVATVFGLLGLLWIGIGLYFAIISIHNYDRFILFFMTPMFIVLGGIVVAVAWQNLRHFGPNGIKNLTFLAVFFLYYSYLSRALYELTEEATWTLKIELLLVAKFLLPLILAFFLYSVVSRKLIQITTKNNQQAAKTDRLKPSA